MPNAKDHFVGLDVAKDWLDVAVLGEKRTKQFANTKREIAGLAKWMWTLNSKLIVVEATGGYEEALVLALFEAGRRGSDELRHRQKTGLPQDQRRTTGCTTNALYVHLDWRSPQSYPQTTQ